MASAGSLQSLRSANVAAVLETVAAHGGASRAEIARFTGLARTTVSTVVGDLVADGSLVEARRRPSGRAGGRPAAVVTVNPAAGTAVGVHLAHDSVRVALADLAGRVRAQHALALDVDTHPEAALGFVARAVGGLQAAARRAWQAGPLLTVGVAMSAPIQVDRAGRTGPGRVGAGTGPDLLPRWHDVDVRRDLRRRIGVPVSVGNDANLGALAEWTWGAGRGVDDLVYVMLSDGVGAGLVLDGRVHTGAAGGAGELGHVVVDPDDGVACRCGNRGCLETVAGSSALRRALAASGAPPDLRDVVARARDGEPAAVEAVTAAGRATGRALAAIYPVLDPQRVVLGGRVVAAGPVVVDAVRSELVRLLPPAAASAVQVVAGTLGDDAEVRGAVAQALRRVDHARMLLGAGADEGATSPGR